MSEKIIIKLDDKYGYLVQRRISDLQSENADTLEEMGRADVADSTRDADVEVSTYVSQLIKSDLEETGYDV